MNSKFTPQQVLDVVKCATSQDAIYLKPAEEQLKTWETEPGFYSILTAIFTDQSVDTNVRWLAVLYFKNGVDRYWRKLAPNAISEEEKNTLKSQLLSLPTFNEPVNQIATQLAVLIGKIARLDCPHQWQNLIPTLLEAIKCDTPLIQQRALMTLHQVVKALASKRLATDRKMFEALTENMFGFVNLLWNNYTSNFFQVLQQGDSNSATVFLDHSILIVKILRRLIVFGFKHPENNPEAIDFIRNIFQQTEAFLKAKSHLMTLSNQFLPKREKIIIQMTKVILDFQEYHPEAFVNFIMQALEFSVRFNFTEEGTDLLFERFQVNAFNVIRSILRCELYKPAKSLEETKNQVTLKAYKLKMDFFTSSTLDEIGRRLIYHYLVLTQNELEIWDSDPEDFIAEEGGDSWKYSLRPCTENLYLTIMKEFRVTFCPVVITLMQEVQQKPCESSDLAAILRKDAVFNAVGLAAFDLFEDVDFDNWFSSTLLKELENNHPNFRIIKRRVIWLIGCWVGVKMSAKLRPKLYETVIPFLNPSEDLVVRLESAYTLRCAVDDFEFEVAQFLPNLNTCFNLLYQLLIDASECETKMQVLYVMSFIVERMKTEVRPYADSLISYLPLLWKNSEEHHMLRCAIITTSTYIVWGLGDVSVSMYDFILPIIKYSTDVNNQHHIYLYEDALELWLSTIQSAPNIHVGVLELFENMPQMLDLGGETFRICIKIIESYFLLAPNEFLQMFAPVLVKSLENSLTDLKNEGVVMVYKAIELLFRIFPVEGPKVFASMLPDLLRAILNDSEYPMVVGIKLTLYARVILQNQTFFFQVVDEISKQWNVSSDDLVKKLLETWIEKMDNVIQPERRKLMSLALISLLTTRNKIILNNFAGIINIAVETLHDVCRQDENGKQEDSFLLERANQAAASADPDELETPHDQRKSKLLDCDPVYCVSLRQYVSSQLEMCQQQLGGEGFEQLMQTVDCEIVEQLKQFIK